MNYLSSRSGIVLAGGNGTRLAPLTSAISKQLLPVYDKPMIYYPITTLMLCGIRDILIVTNPHSFELFKALLGNGEKWGVNFGYAIQDKAEGVAQAILLAEEFIKNNSIVIALGDNIFHGNNLVNLLRYADKRIEGGSVFAYPVSDPQNYGVVQFDKEGNILDIKEKPDNPLSQYAITGLYFYDNSVFERVRELRFSSRGELEITSLNKHYLNQNLLNVDIMGRGIAWLDTGSFDSLQDASGYIRTLEQRQGLKVGCPEEVAWRQGWIDDKCLESLSVSLMNSGYGEYLLMLLKGLK